MDTEREVSDSLENISHKNRIWVAIDNEHGLDIRPIDISQRRALEIIIKSKIYELETAIDDLEERKMGLSDKQTHGRRKSKRQITRGRMDIEEEVRSLAGHIRALRGEIEQPVKLIYKDNDPIDISFDLSAVEGKWWNFITDNKDQLLELSSRNYDILQKLFYLRYMKEYAPRSDDRQRYKDKFYQFMAGNPIKNDKLLELAREIRDIFS